MAHPQRSRGRLSQGVSMKPQTAAVYAYLCRHGKLTPLQALEKLGSFRLASRIDELRKDGIDVKTTLVTKNGKRFAVYSLAA